MRKYIAKVYIPRLESFTALSGKTLEWVQLVDRFQVLAKFHHGFGGVLAVFLSAFQANNVDLIASTFIGVILGGIFGTTSFGFWSSCGSQSSRLLTSRSLARG